MSENVADDPPSAAPTRPWDTGLVGWTRRCSIRTQLLAGVVVLLAPVTVGFGVWGIESQRAGLLDAMQQKGKLLTDAAAVFCISPLLQDDIPVLITYVETLSATKQAVVFAQIHDREGRTIARAGDNVAPSGVQVFSAQIRIPEVGFDPADAKVIGRVVIGLSTEADEAALRRSARMRMIECIASFVVLFAGLSWLNGRLVGRPLRQLDREAQRLGSGQLDQPIALAQGGEYGRLARTLDNMRRNLRASNEDIRKQNEQLLELDRMKSEFLATMSHEIRTPMNGVIGFAHELLETALSKSQRDMVRVMTTSADSLLNIVNDILDFSKVQANRIEIEHIPFDLAELVGDVATLARPQLNSGVRLEVELHGTTPPRSLSDPTRLRQVLTNLVSNAVKFTDRGRITLRVDATKTEGAAHRVRIEVRDTGIGIAPETIDGLFEPFRQGDGSFARRFGGTGLGLAISHGLVKRLGGMLQVESQIGKGSAFSFTIELADCEGPSTEPAEEITALPAGARVLVAEDNAINRRLAVHVLKKLGLDVVTAEDGGAAVETFFDNSRGFDVVLMDCQMPEVDGFAATREIRNREPAGDRVPIIALTANAMPGDRERCLEAGMDDYLTKPLQIGQLRTTLALWLPTRHAAPVAPST